MYSFTGYASGLFYRCFPDRLSHWHGVIFLPKFTQTGQQRYAHGEATLTILRVKRRQHTVGGVGKGNTETGLCVARLGGLGKPWQIWAARITPSLTAAVRAPEIALAAFYSHYRRT